MTAPHRTPIPTIRVRPARTYVYPPQVAFGLVPLTWLPIDSPRSSSSSHRWPRCVGAVALVGVRDVRCYAAVLLWAPTWNSLDTLNVSSALALGVALVWRFRATLWPLAATLGAMVSVKLFLWPMLVWVGLTRRPAGCDPRARARARHHAGVVGGDRVRRAGGLPGAPLPRRRTGELLDRSDRRRARDRIGRARALGHRGRSAPRCGDLEGRRETRGSRVHARSRGGARAQPGRLAALPHAAHRAARAGAPALLGALAPADSAVGEPA